MKNPWNWKRYFLIFLGFAVLIFSCYCVFAALYSYKQSRIKPQGHSSRVMMVRPLSLDWPMAPYSEYESDPYPSNEWEFPESSEQEEESSKEEEEPDDDEPPILDPNWESEPDPSEEFPSEPEPGDGEEEPPPDGEGEGEEGEDPPPEDTPPEPEEPQEDEPEMTDTELLLGIKDSVDGLLICFLLCMSCGVVFLICRAVWPLFRGW